MKILLINKFLYPKGGDAISTLNTGELLISKGHKVIFWGMEHSLNLDYPYKKYFVSNVNFNDTSTFREKVKNVFNIFYSFQAKKELEKLIKIDKPDIVHLNNFAHQISPSILHVVKKYNLPMVMTMHDYKLVCASYMLLSKERVCELCKNEKYYNCFLQKCVKDSSSKSLLNTMEMYLHHKFMHIYDLIDVFISPSKFLKDKVGEMGFKKRVVYLPNFINLDEYVPQYEWKEKAIVYFGRLSREKGLVTLIEAMEDVPDVMLKIIGEGPMKIALGSRAAALGLKNIKFLGYKSGEDLKNEIRESMFVVLPSEWNENSPCSIIEGFAMGKPVVGARIGGIPELVIDNVTGLTFESGNVDGLRTKIQYLTNEPGKIMDMGKNARLFVEKEFNMEKHYEKLMEIYSNALERIKK